jgi:type IV pilus assembly protein PilV
MHHHSRLRRAAAGTTQRGVSMVELLVSLLIFTFGMLGLAGLQTRTLTFNQSSLFRSQAVALTDDILDRMRADRVSALLGRWDTDVATTSVAGTSIYQQDLSDWKSQVSALLPSGQASIETTLAGGAAADVGNVTITIQWDDTRQAAETPGAGYAPTVLKTTTKL